MVSRLHWFAASLRPVELLAPCTDLTRNSPQPTGTFTPELPASRSPFSSSGITTVATERFHRWDFHPLEYQLASLHRLFHPLLQAGLARRTVTAWFRQPSAESPNLTQVLSDYPTCIVSPRVGSPELAHGGDR